MRLAFLTAICLLASSHALADSSSPGAALDTALEQAARATKAGAVLHVEGCGIQYLEARGVANRKTKTPMPTGEPLRLASIGKLYTAAVIHKLVDDGALDLDASLNTYLGAELDGLPNSSATLRQLLNHTSGIPDYYDWRSYLFRDWTRPITPEFALRVARRGRADFPPGTAYEYSNTNYQLLGLVAEKVSDQPLGELIKATVIDPLDLTQTHYHTSHPGGTIHGYGAGLRPWKSTWRFAENTGADSGVTAPATEVATFLRALFLEDGALNTLGAGLLSSQVQAGSENRIDGAGAEILVGRNGRQLIGHTGDTFGYLSFAFAVPDYDATLVGQISASNSAAFRDLLLTSISILRDTCALADEAQPSP